MKQGDNSTRSFSCQPAVGFPGKKIDMEMKEANKAAEGLAASKHAVKKLSEEEIDRIVQEIGLEEEKLQDENKEMEDDNEGAWSDLFNTP